MAVVAGLNPAHEFKFATRDGVITTPFFGHGGMPNLDQVNILYEDGDATIKWTAGPTDEELIERFGFTTPKPEWRCEGLSYELVSGTIEAIYDCVRTQ